MEKKKQTKGKCVKESKPPKQTKEHFVRSIYLGEETKSRKARFVDVW